MSSTWLEKYNALCYRNSIFFKDPILYADYKRLNTELLPCVYRATTIWTNFLFSQEPRQKIPSRILQSESDPEDWHSSNNILVNISGPYKSARNVNKDSIKNIFKLVTGP